MKGKKRKPRKVQQGEGFGDFIKKAGNVLGKVNDFARNNKLATKALDVINAVGIGGSLPGAVTKGLEFAKSKGYGKRKRGRGTRLSPAQMMSGTGCGSGRRTMGRGRAIIV
jgi:hypothetical protein